MNQENNMSQKITKINKPKQPTKTSVSGMGGLDKTFDNYDTIVVSPIGEPTFTPKRQLLSQQIKIVTDSLTAPTARRLYIYSFELSDWLYMTLST